MKQWICSCGQMNDGNFCGNCGKPKRVTTIKKIAWHTDANLRDTKTPSKTTADGSVNRLGVSLSKEASRRDEANATKKALPDQEMSSPLENHTKNLNESPSDNLVEEPPSNQDFQATYIPPPPPPPNEMKLNHHEYYFYEESLFDSITRDPKEFFRQRKDILYKALAFFLLFVLTGVNFTGSNGRHSSSPPPSVATSEEQPPAPTVTTVLHKKYSLPSKDEMHRVTSELSLGGISLGDKMSNVHDLIGQNTRVRNDDFGFTRYYYPDIEVVTKRNDGNGELIEALVSKTPNVETKRGVHQHSAKQDVISRYGSNYLLSEQDGNTLLEYPFLSAHGKKSLLRFALKGDSVEYISVRTISDEIQQPVAEQPVADKPAGDNVALQIFRSYWNKLNNRNFAESYAMMTESQQNQMGVFENYRRGYDTMIENKLTEVSILENSDTVFKVSYTLQAKDRIDGRVKVQVFQGTGILVKVGDDWKIDHLEALLVNSFNE